MTNSWNSQPLSANFIKCQFDWLQTNMVHRNKPEQDVPKMVNSTHAIIEKTLNLKQHYQNLLIRLLDSPSASTSFIISCNSASVGFCPNDLITVPNSLVVMVPSPSLSNSENASLNSTNNGSTMSKHPKHIYCSVHCVPSEVSDLYLKTSSPQDYNTVIC